MCKFLSRAFNQQAISLVEVLLTVTVLSVALTMIIRSQMVSLQALKYAEEYSVAALLLENKMAELIKKGFIARDIKEQGPFAPPHENFSYVFETRRAQGRDGLAPLNEVDLSVSWPSGQTRRKIAETLYLFNAL